jgi:RNA polymerase sigma-70 factor (ECF subfamily)
VVDASTSAFPLQRQEAPVPALHDDVGPILERFRSYLETLTFIQVDPRLRGKFGRSDIISKTLLEAFQELERLEGLDDEAQKRLLRTMLINNLRDEVRLFLRGGRDVALELPLRAAAEASSSRLQEWLAADSLGPLERTIRQEQELRMLDALAQLPERERQALVLQQYHGWKLAAIAEHLNCTTGAVAGLQARALARLRTLLPEPE